MYLRKLKYDLNAKSNCFNLSQVQNYLKLSYQFHFVSLIPINVITNLRNVNWTQTDYQRSNGNYLLIKQSYLILTWLSYATLSTSAAVKKDIKFMTLPIRRKRYTLIKAPMAHKTNSLEQYGFKFYYFKASFFANMGVQSGLSSVDFGALFAVQLKKLFPIFSTNLLLLKYYSITFTVFDINYFNYFTFISKRKKL